MPLNPGNVTIPPSGVEVATGLAGEIFAQLLANTNAAAADPQYQVPAGPTGAGAKEGMAIVANSIATAVVAHIIANAQVATTVTTEIGVSACISGGVVAGVNGTAAGTGSGSVT